MRLFLGVDGGQSSTTALIGDESGRVLGAGVSGPCNHVSGDEARRKLTRVLLECVGQACDQAGLRLDAIRFESACFGMSGGPADKERVLAEVLPATRIVLRDDAEIALSGAMAGGPGIITIAGTGSIARGRNGARKARAGGWGYIFGDEGGGFDIARQALRAALRMEEGWGRPTALRDALLAATGAADVNAAMHLFYTPDWPRSRVAKLARVVDQAAVDGDLIADEILTGAAQQLAVLAASVRQILWEPEDQVRVAYIGGVFRSDRLRERFRMLVEMEGRTECGPPEHSPAAGALLEAYTAARVAVTLSGAVAPKT